MKSKTINCALLEIGSEELPSRFIDPALVQLKKILSKEIEDTGLTFSKIEVWGTPRRLAALIQDLPTKAPDRVDVAVGPPPQAAQDEKGNWTPAATGFAKAQKVSVSKLVLENTPKGERYVVHHAKKGLKTEQYLKEIFPSVISKLNFPKNMMWEPSQFRFARPIRWIVALYNAKVIRFKLAGVTSDKNTFGLLSQGPKKISVSKPNNYKELLRGRCIIVDPLDRQQKIMAQLETITKKLKPAGHAIATEEHINEVVHLTEFPSGIRGEFEEKYLKLPKEVIVSVLRKHQKFFPIETLNQKMTPYFIGVRNGQTDHQESVKSGYERVTRARLADAEFFFNQDLKTPLEDLVPKLKGVGFIPQFGSLWDKTNRVIEISRTISEKINIEVDSSLLKKGATLAKADLLTHMVGELPELQGVAGRFYCENQDQPKLGQIIEQHYWPLTAEGELPKNEIAAIISVADKIDTLTAHFAAGQIPTGSQDPFGLRRAAMGVLRIILERKWALSPQLLIEMSSQQLPDAFRSNQKSQTELATFINQRLINWLKDQKYRPDEIDAVLSNPNEFLHISVEKLKGLKSIRGRSEFESLSAAIKRARNILKQAELKGFSPQTLNGISTETLEDKESNLYNALKSAEPKVSEALESGKYKDAFLALAPLKGPVDDFFEGVMVMVDDEKLRNLRLSLLATVKNLFDSVADFSKIQQNPPQ